MKVEDFTTTHTGVYKGTAPALSSSVGVHKPLMQSGSGYWIMRNDGTGVVWKDSKYFDNIRPVAQSLTGLSYDSIIYDEFPDDEPPAGEETISDHIADLVQYRYKPNIF